MTATRNYRVDSFVSGLAIKAPVHVATNLAITLSGEQVVNSKTLTAGMRVLVKDQADPIENGVYTVETGSWQRAGDFDGSRDIVAGTVVPAYRVSDGQFVYYILDGVGATVLLPGTDSLTFSVYFDPTTGVTQNLQAVTDVGNQTTNILSTGSIFIEAIHGGTLLADYTDGNNHIRIGPSGSGHYRITATGGRMEFTTDGAGQGFIFFNGGDLNVIDGGSIYNEEKLSANVDLVGYGQFWVRNDTPCTPMFTDDAGNDYVLNASATITPPIQLNDDELFLWGTGSDIQMRFEAATQSMRIAATAANIPWDFRDSQIIRLRNALDSGYVEIQNTGLASLNTLEIRKGAGSTTSVEYTLGAWDHNDNRLLRPVLDDYGIQHQSISSSGGALTINFENGNSVYTLLTENITSLTLSNPPVSGRLGQIEIYIIQDSTPRTITWPGSIDWDGGIAPDLSTANGQYLVHLRTHTGGAAYLGVWSGPFS